MVFKTIAGFIVEGIIDKLKEERTLESGKNFAEGVVRRSTVLGKVRETANDLLAIPDRAFDGMGLQGRILKQFIGLEIEKRAETNNKIKQALSLADTDFAKAVLDGIDPGEILDKILPEIDEKIDEAADKAVTKLNNSLKWQKVNADKSGLED